MPNCQHGSHPLRTIFVLTAAMNRDNLAPMQRAVVLHQYPVDNSPDLLHSEIPTKLIGKRMLCQYRPLGFVVLVEVAWLTACPARYHRYPWARNHNSDSCQPTNDPPCTDDAQKLDSRSSADRQSGWVSHIGMELTPGERVPAPLSHDRNAHG